RAVIYTVAPHSPSPTAIPRPIPLLAPVTRQTKPRKSDSLLDISYSISAQKQYTH
uniref:Uncharacterized protein n=1 Tax=Mesocestoides corti TaxID=53468 RepID=A0A5K3G3F0_MESCO